MSVLRGNVQDESMILPAPFLLSRDRGRPAGSLVRTAGSTALSPPSNGGVAAVRGKPLLSATETWGLFYTV